MTTDTDADTDTNPNSKYLKRAKNTKVSSINKMDECIKECKRDFDENMGEYIGLYFEERDESDSVTRDVQHEISMVNWKCKKMVKESKFKRLVGGIPLPQTIPAIQRRNVLLQILDDIELSVETSTSNRKAFGKVCAYAFKSEATLQSLREGDTTDAKWQPKFQLLQTESSEHTWAILGYTEKSFRNWWKCRRAKTEVDDSCADLKALCKSVVFISDVTYLADIQQHSFGQRLKKLTFQCQDIAVMLVRQMSLHPEYADGISTLFGLSVPLIFAFSGIADKAKELSGDPAALLEVKAEHLLQRISVLEPLMQGMVQHLEKFGANLRYRPYAAAAQEDIDRLIYVPKPSVAHLLSMHSDEMTDDAQTILLETGLAKDKESLKGTVERIQSEEIEEVALRIVEEREDESYPGYDLTVLKGLGLNEILISDVPRDMLGFGASSAVFLYASREDSTKLLAVKQNKVYGKKTWNRLTRESSIWVTLEHENIVPLLGYCMLSTENPIEHPIDQYPALVTPWCTGGNLKSYLKAHHVSDTKKLQFLHGIVSGLEYLHSKKISHGDLRATNVLVDESSGNSRAMICDFGLSNFFAEVADRIYNETGDQKTGDKWLAPELMFVNNRAIVRVSNEGDIYAFGCVILEVVFGKEPYHNCPPRQESCAKRNGELPASKKDMDEVYWTIAEKCWEYLPRERPTAEWIVSFIANRLRRDEGEI